MDVASLETLYTADLSDFDRKTLRVQAQLKATDELAKRVSANISGVYSGGGLSTSQEASAAERSIGSHKRVSQSRVNAEAAASNAVTNAQRKDAEARIALEAETQRKITAVRSPITGQFLSKEQAARLKMAQQTGELEYNIAKQHATRIAKVLEQAYGVPSGGAVARLEQRLAGLGGSAGRLGAQLAPNIGAGEVATARQAFWQALLGSPGQTTADPAVIRARQSLLEKLVGTPGQRPEDITRQVTRTPLLLPQATRFVAGPTGVKDVFAAEAAAAVGATKVAEDETKKWAEFEAERAGFIASKRTAAASAGVAAEKAASATRIGTSAQTARALDADLVKFLNGTANAGKGVKTLTQEIGSFVTQTGFFGRFMGREVAGSTGFLAVGLTQLGLKFKNSGTAAASAVTDTKLLNSAYKEFQKTVEQVGGSQVASAFFKQLGIVISPQQFEKPKEAFTQFVTQARGLGSETEKAAVGAAVFGKETEKLTPLLAANTVALRAEATGFLGLSTAETIAVGSTAAFVAIGVIAAAGMVVAGVETANWEAKLYDLHKQTGLSVESLSVLRIAAEDAGLELKDLVTGTDIYIRRIADAASGNKAATARFAEFGITQAQLKKASTSSDEALKLLFERIAAAPTAFEKMQIAQELSSRSGALWVRIVEESGGSLDELIKKVKQYGDFVTGPQAAASKEFELHAKQLSHEWEGFKETIGNGVIPELNKLLYTLSQPGWNIKFSAITGITWGGLLTPPPLPDLKPGEGGTTAYAETIRKLNEELEKQRNRMTDVTEVARTTRELLNANVPLEGKEAQALLARASANDKLKESLDQANDSARAQAERLREQLAVGTRLILLLRELGIRLEQTGKTPTELEKFDRTAEALAATSLPHLADVLKDVRDRFAELQARTEKEQLWEQINHITGEASRLRGETDRTSTEFLAWELKHHDLLLRMEQGVDELGHTVIGGTELWKQYKAALDDLHLADHEALLKKFTEPLSQIGDRLAELSTGKINDELQKTFKEIAGIKELKIEPGNIRGLAQAVEEVRKGTAGVGLTTLTATEHLQALVGTSLQNAAGQLGNKFNFVRDTIVGLLVNSKELDDQLKRSDGIEKYARLVGDLQIQLNRDRDNTNQSRIAKQLLTKEYENLTEAQKKNLIDLARSVDATKKAREEERQHAEDMRSVADDLAGITSNLLQNLHTGTRAVVDMVDSLLKKLSSTLLQQFFEGLLVPKGVLDEGKAPKSQGGIAGFLADLIPKFGGRGATGGSQAITLADNTKVTIDNTNATQQLTAAMGGVTSVTGGGGASSIGKGIVGSLGGALGGLLGKAFGLGGTATTGASSVTVSRNLVSALDQNTQYIANLTKVITDLTQTIQNQSGGGTSNGGIGDLFSSLSSGGQQHGGPVTAGKLYRVNEAGVEYFRPGVSGQIIPLGDATPAASGAASNAVQKFGNVTLTLADTNVALITNTSATQENTITMRYMTQTLQQPQSAWKGIGSQLLGSAIGILMGSAGGILSGLFGGGGGGKGNIPVGGVAGKAQHGTWAEAGKLYQVNENRTEYFRPNMSGRILSLGEEQTAFGKMAGHTNQRDLRIILVDSEQAARDQAATSDETFIQKVRRNKPAIKALLG